MTDQNTPTYEVAIIGLGPVGATLANLLGQMGVCVVALESSEEISLLPRAVAFAQLGTGSGFRARCARLELLRSVRRPAHLRNLYRGQHGGGRAGDAHQGPEANGLQAISRRSDHLGSDLCRLAFPDPPDHALNAPRRSDSGSLRETEGDSLTSGSHPAGFFDQA